MSWGYVKSTVGNFYQSHRQPMMITDVQVDVYDVFLWCFVTLDRFQGGFPNILSPISLISIHYLICGPIPCTG